MFLADFLRKHFLVQEAEKRRSDRLAYPQRAVNKHERTSPGRRVSTTRVRKRVRRCGTFFIHRRIVRWPQQSNRNFIAPTDSNCYRTPMDPNRTSPRRSRPRLAIAIGGPSPPENRFRSSVTGEPDSKTLPQGYRRLGSSTGAERIKSRLMRLSQILVPRRSPADEFCLPVRDCPGDFLPVYGEVADGDSWRRGGASPREVRRCT